MTPQELVITIAASVFLGGGGTLGVWALASRWAARRMSLADRRSEIEIEGEAAEQKARLGVFEEQRRTVESQRRTVERVAETHERFAGALEAMAGSYAVMAQHAASVNDRLDRIEDALGIRRGSAVPVPPPPARPPTASASGGATPPPQQ